MGQGKSRRQWRELPNPNPWRDSFEDLLAKQCCSVNEHGPSLTISICTCRASGVCTETAVPYPRISGVKRYLRARLRRRDRAESPSYAGQRPLRRVSR